MKKLAEFVWKVKHTGRWFLTAVVVIVVVVVGYGYYVFVTQVSGQAVISERIEALYQKVQLQARRHGLKKADFSNYGLGESQTALAAFAGELVDDDVRKIIIINRNQVTVWSSEAALIGSESEANKLEIQRAVKGEVVAAHPFGSRPFIFPSANTPADLFVPIHSDDGSTLGVIIVSKDFSEVVSLNASIAVVTIVFVVVIIDLLWIFLHMRLRQRQDSLTKEEGKIGAVLEQMPVGLAVIHEDGEILLWNAQMVILSGTNEVKDVMGKNAFNLPLFKLLGLDVAIRAGTAGKPFETDTRVTALPHGQETWRHWRGIPIFTTGGKRVEYLLLLVNDITDKKRKSV